MEKRAPSPRYFIAIILSIGTFVVASQVSSGELPFLHTVDLVFHEAGHTIFSPLGEFMQVLGGTVIQLAIPVALLGYFWRRYDTVSAFLMLWWVGQNLLDIGVYAGDARAQAIQLIGGEHDWAYLLGKINLLEYDVFLAKTLFFIGIFIMVTAIWLTVFHKDSAMHRKTGL